MVVREPDTDFADIEELLMSYLSTLAPTDTVTPDDSVPVGIRINRVGGEDDTITDYPRVQVSVFAPTRNDANRIGERARQMLLVLGGEQLLTDDGKRVTIDYCRTDVPPETVPYENPDRDFVTSYYRLGLMRPRS